MGCRNSNYLDKKFNIFILNVFARLKEKHLKTAKGDYILWRMRGVGLSAILLLTFYYCYKF